MYEAYTADRLNSEVWCRLGPSKIHGVGVIAIRDIPSGTSIVRKSIGSITFTKPEWLQIDPAIKLILLDRNCFLQDWGGHAFVSDHPNSHQDFIVHMNYSATPNMNFGGTRTIRDIKAGEELTENYSPTNKDTVRHMQAQRFIKDYKMYCLACGDTEHETGSSYCLIPCEDCPIMFSLTGRNCWRHE